MSIRMTHCSRMQLFSSLHAVRRFGASKCRLNTIFINAQWRDVTSYDKSGILVIPLQRSSACKLKIRQAMDNGLII